MTTPPGYVLIKSSDFKSDTIVPKEHDPSQKGVDLKMSTESKCVNLNKELKFVALKQNPKGIEGYSIGQKPKTYQLLFRAVTNRTNGVGGTDTTSLSFDVSGTTEFTAAAALFSECRVRAAKVTLSPSLPSAGVVSRQFVGFQPNSGASLSAEADVQSLQPLKMFTTGRTTPLVLKVDLGDSMRWASVSSPVPGPYAGLYGAFWFSSTGQASMSTVTALYEILIEFRGRH